MQLVNWSPMQGSIFRSAPSRLSLQFCNTLSDRISLSRIAWCENNAAAGDSEPKPSSVNPINPNSNSSVLSSTLLSGSVLNPFSNGPLSPPLSNSRTTRHSVEESGRRNLPNYGEFRSVGSRSDSSVPSIPGKFSKYSKPIRNIHTASTPARVQRTNRKNFRRPMENFTSPPARSDTESARDDATGSTGKTLTSSNNRLSKAPESLNSGEKLPDWMLQFQFSYSEVPKAPILGFRETPYSPFGPQDLLTRPWTGKAPLSPQKKKVPEFDSFNPPPTKKGVKYVQKPGPFLSGQGPKEAKTREEILGEPLTAAEVKELVESCIKGNKQVNLGRDGLTHNMLEVIHTHWKRSVCCKVKCKGVPTVDMDNLVRVIEEKTGGVVIERAGGVCYLFRGRNYNYKDRPKFPLMLWKPPAPIYPKLIQPVPEGFTEDEAKALRSKGRKVAPLCKLSKNGVYMNLVKEVRAQFRVDEVVRVDCTGLNPSDYKKIGAKLKELVPCVLLSFEKEQIIMCRDKVSEVETGQLNSRAEKVTVENCGERIGVANNGTEQSLVPQEISETRIEIETMMKPDETTSGLECNEVLFSAPHVDEVEALWQKAIEEGKALQLDNQVVDSDAIFEKAAELSVALNCLDSNGNESENMVHSLGTYRKAVEENPEQVPGISPFDKPPMGGLAVDELAKLLAP